MPAKPKRKPRKPAPATSERRNGLTPAGGAYAVAYFMDDEGNGVPKAKATRMEIVEFDESDREIQRTYMVRPAAAGGV